MADWLLWAFAVVGMGATAALVVAAGLAIFIAVVGALDRDM